MLTRRSSPLRAAKTTAMALATAAAVAPATAPASGLVPQAGPWPAPIIGVANPLAGTPYMFNGADARTNAGLRIWLRVRGVGRTAITRAVGDHIIVSGELRNRDTHRAISSATLTVVAEDVYAGLWVAIRNVQTSRRGRFRAVLLVTARHLRVAAIYYPAVTSTVPIYSRRVLVRASPRVWLGTPHRIRRTVRFHGRVSAGPAPVGGLLVALQVHNTFRRWVTARLDRTRPDGRYQIAYRFPRGGRLTVRVLVPGRQPGWPLYAGASARVGLRLR
jgi:hypothetical protein